MFPKNQSTTTKEGDWVSGRLINVKSDFALLHLDGLQKHLFW